MAMILASILSADQANLAQECTKLLENGIDGIHVDVMDDHFVPNLSYSPSVVAALRKHFPTLFIDCHLMVENPTKAGASSLSMHIECFETPQEAVGAILHVKNCGMKCGLAIKPETSIEGLLFLMNILDFVLVMTVSPGFGGQKMIEKCLTKAKELRAECPNLNIEVDGGITPENVHIATEAGCNWIVSGTGICASSNQKETIRLMRQKVKSS